MEGICVAPRCKVGSWLKCRIRGCVQVTGSSDGILPWPRTKVSGGSPLVVCGDLVKALRRESASAIRAHFGSGVSYYSVWAMRKTLGVPRMTEGTTQLFREEFPAKLMTPEAIERTGHGCGRQKGL